ncbi:hypothetical protein DYBT9275_00550 [Dyadobacter sp. CECT 9275]|uniref:HMA domain-containing protein n=1 Tax=Dyadobacter helix TaxID=2822344 RepID=A0A916J880_9BACT|nr:heavy-metal-associated domain-containing protein [Dyadobacter sp. CECT 9275]CAG4990529.1 hypothetical protein DYBT9275_00550 [Dyadobacter sp. CECT 9275]
MQTLKFKTNIKCDGCVATVTPFLNGDEHIENWQVDLQSADRVLTVTTDQSAAEISELVKKAGYAAQEFS